MKMFLLWPMVSPEGLSQLEVGDLLRGSIIPLLDQCSLRRGHRVWQDKMAADSNLGVALVRKNQRCALK